MLRFALLLALFASACGGYQGVRSPELTPSNARWQRILQRQARTELGCAAVRLIPLSDSVIQADGCMHVAEYALFCYSRRNCDWRALEGVARHAERDLSCPGATIAVTASGPLTRNAVGCGRAIDYTMVCSTEHCVWTPSAAPAAVAPVAVTAMPSGMTGAVSGGPVVSGSTDGAAIPPPPGATPAPGGTTDDAVIPPPPGSTPPPATTGGESTDDAVIPPPPT